MDVDIDRCMTWDNITLNKTSLGVTMFSGLGCHPVHCILVATTLCWL